MVGQRSAKACFGSPCPNQPLGTEVRWANHPLPDCQRLLSSTAPSSTVGVVIHGSYRWSFFLYGTFGQLFSKHWCLWWAASDFLHAIINLGTRSRLDAFGRRYQVCARVRVPKASTSLTVHVMPDKNSPILGETARDSVFWEVSRCVLDLKAAVRPVVHCTSSTPFSICVAT